jgi:hypothetical protein
MLGGPSARHAQALPVFRRRVRLVFRFYLGMKGVGKVGPDEEGRPVFTYLLGLVPAWPRGRSSQ